jgi:hypothetical protein
MVLLYRLKCLLDACKQAGWFSQAADPRVWPVRAVLQEEAREVPAALDLAVRESC